MCRVGAKSRRVPAWVCGDQLSPEVGFYQRVAGVELDLLANVLMGHRVAVQVVLDVVIDIDLDRLDRHIFVGLRSDDKIGCGSGDQKSWGVRRLMRDSGT